MSGENIAEENYQYINRGYYPRNFQNYPMGNYRAGYGRFNRRSGYGNYPYGARFDRYGGAYSGYGKQYDNDDFEDYYDDDDRPYNIFYSPFHPYGPRHPYGFGRGSGRNWPMSGMWQHPTYDNNYNYGQMPDAGYGPMYSGPMGFFRNLVSYNPVTNWARSPRGNNFLRGLGIATAGIILAPAVIRTIRPLAVQAVHGAMSIAGEMKGVVTDAREELEDIFADGNFNNKEERIQEG